MKKTAYLIILLLVSGCTTMQYGSFINKEIGDYSIIIVDAIQKMKNLYLPAKSKLILRQDIKERDIFGQDLMVAVRRNGYSIQEYDNGKPSNKSIDFRYRLDKIESMFYLSMHFNNESISRAYSVTNGKLTPHGSWSRVENSHE